jgi:anti-anti-sigma regulatory factor
VPGITRRIGAHPSLVIGRFLSTAVVTVHGELGVGAAVRLGELIEVGETDVVVDLRHVVATDRPGLDMVASAARRMEDRGGQLRLARASGPIADAVAAAGIGRLLIAPEQAHRAWPPNERAGGVSRRAAIRAHPAAGRQRTGASK